MANELLTKSAAEAIFDSIAKQYQLMLAGVGTDAVEADTYAKGADNFRADIAAAIGSNMWLADLADAATAYSAAAQMSGAFLAGAGDVMRAIEQHVRKRHPAYQNINDWLSDKGIKVHPYCKAILPTIATTNVWPLTLETTDTTNDEGNEVASPGHYAVTGAGTGTFTAGTALNTALYGDGLIKAVCTHAIGAGTDLVVTITGKDVDGTTVTATVTITAGSASATEFDVASTRFASITATTHTNGTALDAWTYIFRDDRVPTL